MAVAVSRGLSAATVAFSVAGAAADAVPIAKQILNSAAQISAAAERIKKKREAMYTLLEKVDIYSTQIDIAVAGRILDASLQRRLERLYSVFVKIEALVDARAASGEKNHALARVWRNVVIKPNRAETLVVELDREIQLLQLLTGIQLSLVVDDTARAVAADARYDGQMRLLRDCDIDKRDIIDQWKTDQGIVVWASARVDGQLMVIRYVDSSSITERGHNAASEVVAWRRAPYQEYLGNIQQVSTVRGSHPHIVQLYGRHVQGPEAVFRSGTLPLNVHLDQLRSGTDNEEDAAGRRLILAYKVLDASSHLAEVHGLAWVGKSATIDENGEPRIGLFDDIVRADPEGPSTISIVFHYNIFMCFDFRRREETGVVEQVHGSSLHAIMTEHLRDGSGSNRLQRVWDTIRQERLRVKCDKRVFPIISENLSLSQDIITQARLYFETKIKEGDSNGDCMISFMRQVLAGGGGNNNIMQVEACTHNNRHIQYPTFYIYIPTECPLLADLLRAVGLPDEFGHSWDGSIVRIYP